MPEPTPAPIPSAPIPEALQARMLDAFDGRLSATELATLEAELRANPAWQREFDALRETWQTLPSGEPTMPSTSEVRLKEKVLSSVKAELAKPDPVGTEHDHGRVTPARRLFLRLLPLAAAVAMVVLALWMNYGGDKNTSKTPALPESGDPGKDPIKDSLTLGGPAKDGELKLTVHEDDWLAEVRQRMERKVTFDFMDTPFLDTLTFLQSLCKMNIVFEPGLEAAKGKQLVSLKVTDMSVTLALQWLCRVNECEYDLRNGALYVFSAGKAKMEGVLLAPRLDPPKNLKAKSTFEFIDSRFDEAVNFIRTLSNATLIIDPKLDSAKTITLKVADMPIVDALEWMCRQAGAHFRFKDGAIYISAEPEAPFAPPVQTDLASLLAARARIPVGSLTRGQLLDLLGGTGTLPVLPSAEMPKEYFSVRIELPSGNASLEEFLARAVNTKTLPLKAEVKEGKILLRTFTQDELLNRKFEVSRESAMPLSSNFYKLAEYLNRTWDGRLPGQPEELKALDALNLDLTNLTVGGALEKLCNAGHWRWEVKADQLLILSAGKQE